jgi:phosphoribosylformylglycinamidine cyclo-ligase
MTKPISYKDAGVDIEKGDLFVERIKKMVGSTYNERVTSGVGGFASLYSMGDDRYLASGTDGVGTKLLLAHECDVHDTIGIDLVAMCVNDILCTGARPLFFLDYLACGKLDLERQSLVMKGIVEGCLQGKMALIGGETAEMPGLYQDGHYDLAGFAVGEVYGRDLLDGRKLDDGVSIVGVASTGPHSNGYSLIRKLLGSQNAELKKQAMIPTKIYVSEVQELRALAPDSVLGLAHITGGGFTNMARLSDSLDVIIDFLPDYSQIPPLFKFLADQSALPMDELYRTFNMGVGLAVMTRDPNFVINFFQQKKLHCWKLGSLKKGQGRTIIHDIEL